MVISDKRLTIVISLLCGSLLVKGFDVDLSQSTISPKSCEGQDALLILVHSAPDHKDFREVIRSTWAKGPHSKLVFLVGRSTSEDLNVQVHSEAEATNDILLYNKSDSYYDLTTKHIFGYRWAVANCPNVKFVLKSDDDGYVDTYHLGFFLSDQGFIKKTKFLLCNVLQNIPVRRSSKGAYAKWNIRQEDFPDETYPTYCSGHAYVTTIATMKEILKAIKIMDSVIHIDDVVVTGLGTKGTDIPFYDWSHYFINTHSSYRDELLDPESHFITPQLMVFFNIEPQDIAVLHRKFSWCLNHSNKCYDKLWKNKDFDSIRRCQQF